MCLDLFSEETPCSSILVGYHLPLATCTQSLDGLLREVRLYAESLCSESWIWHCNSIRTLNCAVYGVGQFFKDRVFLAYSPLAVWVFGPRSVSWRSGRPPENSVSPEKILWYPGPVTWTMSTLIIQPLFEQFLRLSQGLKVGCSKKVNLRGRRSKGMGKGIRARDHARGRRERPTRSRAPKVPLPLPLPLLMPATQAKRRVTKRT